MSRPEPSGHRSPGSLHSGVTAGHGGDEVTATTEALPVAPVNYARCAAADGQPGCAYTASIPADTAYPDTGGRELTDGVRGPAAYHQAWQGRNNVSVYSFTVAATAVNVIRIDAFAITFSDRWPAAETYQRRRQNTTRVTRPRRYVAFGHSPTES